jgi:hypothetical protein
MLLIEWLQANLISHLSYLPTHPAGEVLMVFGVFEVAIPGK